MRLDEISRADLLKDIDKRTKKYSKLVKGATYKGITSDYVVHMSVPSVTSNPPTVYTVKIKLLDFPLLMDDETLTMRERVRLALIGDLSISCTCPAFKWYGYEYILSQIDAHEGDEQTIYPKVRNPKLDGTLCKHAYIAVRLYGKFWSKIAKDILESNFI